MPLLIFRNMSRQPVNKTKLYIRMSCSLRRVKEEEVSQDIYRTLTSGFK